MLTLGLSLVPLLCWAAEPTADQAKAIAEIKKLANVGVDEKHPDKPVIDVRFGVPQADDTDDTSDTTTDAALPLLKGMTQLRRLDLDSTGVTDIGLENLAEMKQLHELNLGGCLQVTDVGLKNLKGLDALEYLYICDTQVTDAGLKFLAGMKQLQKLSLGGAAGKLVVAWFTSKHCPDSKNWILVSPW